MGITLWQSLSVQAERMADNALKDVHSLADWQRIRPQRHKEFMRSMGLDPIPPRCDLKVTDYGGFEGQGFRGRRIGFQLLPDCWSSACVYYPDPMPKGPAPGVLYVCGHGEVGTHSYQSHPIYWARRGYVCLIVDTIEQNDNPGEHHAMEVDTHEAWLALGYTAAGGEMWNAMRALDVLAADSQVDPERLAVTGLSGGGGCSFFLAVADERVKAVSTLCGISTPVDAIVNRHLISHCNCMYPYNVYRRDTSEYAALIAPRAALFCFADDDEIFHPDETRALVDRTRKVYGFYGQDARCSLVTCAGKHGDHPEFDAATTEWFDRHVAGEPRPAVKRGAEELAESTVSVFSGQPPRPNRLDLLPELLTVRGSLPLPGTAGEWTAIRRRAIASLPPLHTDEVTAPIRLCGAWTPASLFMADHVGQIGGMEVRLRTMSPPGGCRKIVVGIASPGEGSMDVMGYVSSWVGPTAGVASVGFEPRLAGVSHPEPETGRLPAGSMKWSIRKLLPFAMPLVGMTPVMMTINDIGAALDYLSGWAAVKGGEIYLYGRGDAGVAALYRGIIDERIAGVIVDDAPSTHLSASPILGILRAFDMPQAVGLMAPRKVALVNPAHNAWTWPSRVYGRLGCPERLIVSDSMNKAMEALLA
jgi:dienelactone hydrolase